MRIVTTIILILFIVSALGFNSALPKVPDVKQVNKTSEAIKAGTAVYESKCRKCHDDTDVDMSKKSYTVMMPLLASMVDMEGLNKKEIENVAAYVYSVSKK